MGEHMAELGLLNSFLKNEMNPINDKYKWKVNENHLKSDCSIYVNQMTKITTFPWGESALVTGNNESQTKIVYYKVKPRHMIPFAIHESRSEHIIIINGIAEATLGEGKITYSNNCQFFIPPSVKHSIYNKSNDELTFYEIQVGKPNAKNKLYNLSEYDNTFTH